MKIRGLIFDMDGVILDSMEMWRGLAPGLLDEFGVELDEAANSRIQAMSVDLATKFLVEEYDFGMTAEELRDHIYKKIEDYYLYHVKMKEGAMDILPILRMARKRVCIATATPRPLTRAALTRNDAISYFGKIFTVPEIGKGKDCPDIFEAAQEWIGGPNEETLVVDDSEIAIMTAKEAGFKTCAVYDGINDAKLDTVAGAADIKIRSLLDLMDMEGVLE